MIAGVVTGVVITLQEEAETVVLTPGPVRVQEVETPEAVHESVVVFPERTRSGEAVSEPELLPQPPETTGQDTGCVMTLVPETFMTYEPLPEIVRLAVLPVPYEPPCVSFHVYGPEAPPDGVTVYVTLPGGVVMDDGETVQERLPVGPEVFTVTVWVAPQLFPYCPAPSVMTFTPLVFMLPQKRIL